ncbi:MAG: hypothetical protein N3D71_01160 [Burkholderiaceae bacterium]|nr:hypothetical protein [Burkholderiaceae bacterium]
MKIDTSKTYSGEEVERLLREAGNRIADQILPFGGFDVTVTRYDGRVERRYVRNIVLKEGLNRLANRVVQGTGTSPFYVIGVGTTTAAHTLNSDQPNWGEVSRKTSNVTGASAQSREWAFMTQTWAGAADGITSVQLETAFISDHPNSHATTGAYFAAANGLSVVLGNSDFLNLTYRVRVGSHDIDHTT